MKSMQRYGTTGLGTLVLAILLLGGNAQAKAAIVGGGPIDIKEAPWQVLLQFHLSENRISTCGATWIGGRWLVTAAHCPGAFTLDSMFVYAGITRKTEKSPSNGIGVARVIIHPDYPVEWKDIALMELTSDITAVDARPIRMASPRDVTLGLTDPGKVVMATGWGGINRSMDKPDTLQRVLSMINDTTRYTITWAGFNAGNVGSCTGDSGGPLAVKDSSGTGWILAGISSKIPTYCGDPIGPSQYTRVSSFFDWVQETTGGVTAVQPPQTTAPKIQWLPASGRFHLGSAQTLDLTFATLKGALVRKTRTYYSEGEHLLPTVDGATAPYILRIHGENLDVGYRGF
jgi:secreted trypsin-like serine protease